MLAAAAVKMAQTRHKMYDEPTMVYYDDDLTYHVISADAYYRIPVFFESDIVWSSDEGYIWTHHKLAQHPG